MSGRLERGLLASGDRVLPVSPGLTETSRRAVREAGKSDPIDATAIARAALREGIDTLPVAHLDENALEIRTLNDYPTKSSANAAASRTGCAGTSSARAGPRSHACPGKAWATRRSVHERPPAHTSATRPTGSRRETDPQTDRPDHRRGTRTARRDQSADRGSLPSTAGRARVRADHRRDHHRPHRRRSALPDRRVLRQAHRHRPNPRQLWQHLTPPAAPRRRPTAEPRDPHHRPLPRTHRPRDPRLPRTQTRRRQEQTRSDPLPQTPPRAPHLAPALSDPDPSLTTASTTTNPAAATVQETHQHDHRRRPGPHAMHSLKPANTNTPLMS